MTNVAQYAKAIVGALVAFLSAVGAGLTDNHLTAAEWVAAAVAGLLALSVIWAVPNAKPEDQA